MLPIAKALWCGMVLLTAPWEARVSKWPWVPRGHVRAWRACRRRILRGGVERQWKVNVRGGMGMDSLQPKSNKTRRHLPPLRLKNPKKGNFIETRARIKGWQQRVGLICLFRRRMSLWGRGSGSWRAGMRLCCFRLRHWHRWMLTSSPRWKYSNKTCMTSSIATGKRRDSMMKGSHRSWMRFVGSESRIMISKII